MANTRRINSRHIISATEVAEFVFCAKAWQLKRAGASARGQQLESGREFHRQHGAQMSLARFLRRAGTVFALIALLLLAAWWWISKPE